MKYTLYYSVALLVLAGCGGAVETSSTSDSTDVAGELALTTELTDEEQKADDDLQRYLQNFERATEGYPVISHSYGNEVVAHEDSYYFEDDNLVWVQVNHSEEGGIAWDHLISRDPEGTFYLHYGMEEEGVFGYKGNDDGTWYEVRPNNMYKPHVVGPGKLKIYVYENDFEEVMNKVRDNRDKFELSDGYYYLEEKVGYNNHTWKFSEVLFNANLLSATSFNPEMIKGYLNWWYPLFEENGKFVRRKDCEGNENYVKLTVEAGNYRWEEMLAGKSIVYNIKGFEESEGDPFYATIERNGARLKKTVNIPEFEGEEGIMTVDGNAYTSNPDKYDVVTMKCN